MILTLPQADRQKRRLITGLATKVLQIFGYRFATVSESLKENGCKYVCFCSESISENLLSLQFPGTLFVTAGDLSPAAWDIVNQLSAVGWEIACSALTPQKLTELSYAEQQRNVSEAREILRAKIGKAPKVFCYPFGAYDATTVNVVRDAGFDAAVSTSRGINNSGGQDTYHLRRLPLPVSSVRQVLTLSKYLLLALTGSGSQMLSNAETSRRRLRSGAVT